MKYLNHALPIAILLISFGVRADLSDELPMGIVYSVNAEKQIVTIINSDTGKRHTYFLNERSKISSKEKVLTLDDIQAGHAVALDFKRTEIGREIDLMRVPELDKLAEIQEIDTESKYFISGTVTGLRPDRRYVILRGPRIMLRMSLEVPKDTKIMFDGRTVDFSKIKIGDVLEAEYRETAQGYQLVNAEIVRNNNQR